MSVGWNDVQDAIKAAVVATGAVTPLAVTWTDEARPAGKVLVVLNIVEASALQDRDDFEPNVDVPGAFTWSLSTLYYIRIQVRVESVNNAPAKDALFTLEQIRAGLLNPALELGADIVLQPDVQTYVHHVSFPYSGRTVSAYAFEIGIRAVLDFPLAGPADAGPNMVEVDIDTGQADVGETDPVVISQVILRD